VAALIGITAPLGMQPVAEADDPCQNTAEAQQSYIGIGLTCGEPGSPAPETGNGDPAQSTLDQSPYVEYRWVSACRDLSDASDPSSSIDCVASRTCPDPADRLWRLWGRTPGAGWTPIGTGCFGRPPTAAQTPKPQVTPGLVLNALRRIGLPRHEVRTQPAGKTLVNFDTIFYTHATPYTRTFTLLGQRVQIIATPTAYTWHHGDGTTATTNTPGAPYPAMDITHDYAHAHTTVQPSVDTTYTARYRVNNGPWQTIPQTVTITGPTTNLRIAEATPVLSGDYE